MRGHRKQTAETELRLAQAIEDARAACKDIVMASPVGSQAYHTLSCRGLAEEDARLSAGVQAMRASAQEDRSLAKSAGFAHGAWDAVERAIWGLAWSGSYIARAEANKLHDSFLDSEDLIQEGFIGLLKAAQRFDADKRVRFTTYARWWVRSQMNRAILNVGRSVRISGCAADQLREIRNIMKQNEAMGLECSLQEIADELGVELQRVELLLKQGRVLSFEERIGAGDPDRTLGNTLADTKTPDPSHQVSQTQQYERLVQVVQQVLPERQAQIISHRYGLQTGQGKTLAETGEAMSLSRERVRQLEQDAFKRLRVPGRLRETNSTS
jgi:DNA-directed RNA polymerase specialized sigma subunit